MKKVKNHKVSNFESDKFANLTCVIPARNEQGYIKTLIDKIETIEQISEIIIVEGGSTDDTFNVVSRISGKKPDKIKLLKQLGTGKFDAVIYGVSVAKNEHVIIWDADGTISVKDTKKLIQKFNSNHSFVMGNRLIGKIETGAMQKANYVGNWFFAILWNPIIGGKPVDVLCGTKIFQKSIVQDIPNWLLRMDPYGDFSLIAATRAKGHQVDSMLVDYAKRYYGQSNIKRWSGGLRLLLLTTIIYLWLGRIKLWIRLRPLK